MMNDLEENSSKNTNFSKKNMTDEEIDQILRKALRGIYKNYEYARQTKDFRKSIKKIYLKDFPIQ